MLQLFIYLIKDRKLKWSKWEKNQSNPLIRTALRGNLPYCASAPSDQSFPCSHCQSLHLQEPIRIKTVILSNDNIYLTYQYIWTGSSMSLDAKGNFCLCPSLVNMDLVRKNSVLNTNMLMMLLKKLICCLSSYRKFFWNAKQLYMTRINENQYYPMISNLQYTHTNERIQNHQKIAQHNFKIYMNISRLYKCLTMSLKTVITEISYILLPHNTSDMKM